MLEIKLDTSEVTLMGNENAQSPSDEVTSRMQIRYDTDLMKLDAYKKCQAGVLVTNTTYVDSVAKARFDLSTTNGQNDYTNYKNQMKDARCNEVLNETP